MTKPDTRRDRPAARRRVAADVQQAHDLDDDEYEPPKTDLEAISDGVRAGLPAGSARKVWDGAGTPGEATLVLAHRLLASRVAVVLAAEKRCLKSLGSKNEDTRKGAEAYLSAVHKGSKQIKDLANSLISLAKTHSDISISGLPDEVHITGADSILEAFASPGPSRDAAPRQPRK